MKTEKNLAKIFAHSLQNATSEIDSYRMRGGEHDDLIKNAVETIDSIAEELEKYSSAADGVDYQGSYELLRDAILEHLDEYVHEDDVAEEAIFIAAIDKAARTGLSRLRELEEMRRIFAWLLGEEGEFPVPPEPDPGKPRRNYWWRGELRTRWENAIRVGHDVLVGAPDPAGGARG